MHLMKNVIMSHSVLCNTVIQYFNFLSIWTKNKQNFMKKIVEKRCIFLVTLQRCSFVPYVSSTTIRVHRGIGTKGVVVLHHGKFSMPITTILVSMLSKSLN